MSLSDGSKTVSKPTVRTDFVQACLPHYFFHEVVSSSDCLNRNGQSGNKKLLKYTEEITIEGTKTTQHGCGEKAGWLQVALKLRLQLQQECHPDHVMIAHNIKHAYNEVMLV